MKKSKYHDILIFIECEETHEYQEYPAFGVMTENGVLFLCGDESHLVECHIMAAYYHPNICTTRYPKILPSMLISNSSKIV